MRSFALRVAILYVCLLICLGLTLPLAAQGDFTVAVTPSSLSIPQNSQETATITTTISGGFNSGIALSATTPVGVAASFSPLIIGAPGAGVSTMTLAAFRLAPLGNYTVTINAVGGGIKHTATLTLTITAQGQPNFTLSASPSLLTIVQGNQGTSTLTTTVRNGFNNSISLSASGVPSGITVKFNPVTIPAPGAGHSTMTITVSGTTPSGTYPITVTASGGGLWQNTAVTVMVASFTVSASPSSLTVAQGNQGTSQITTTVSGGFNYPISLSATGMPANTTVGFNPQTIPAPGAGTSTMTVTVGNNTPAGTYPIAVTGSGGGLMQTVTVSLTVTGGGGFTLAVTPTSLSLPQNSRGFVAATTRINGFNNSIILAATGVPSGVTMTFNPATIPAPGVGNSTINIVVFSTTQAGIYPITISATGGGIKQTATLTLTITVAGQPNFMLSAAPAALSIVQGSQGSSSINSTLSGTFQGAIGLSASGVPSGVTATFSPGTLPSPGSGDSVLTLGVNKSVAVGSYPITVTGNGAGIQQTATVTLTVTPSGALGLPISDFLQPYSYTLQSSFGKPPYSYQLTWGSLPSGLSLSQSGTISGSATATGTFPFSVLVTDSSQPPQQKTVSYTLNAVVGLDAYGGLTAAPVPQCGQTGYFQIVKVNGRWVLADPLCNAFYQRSVYDSDVLFILPQILQQRYNNDIHRWADHSLQRMVGWGFNALDIYYSLYMLPVPAGGEPPASPQVPFTLYYPALKDVEYAWQSLGLPEPVKDLCRGFDSNGYNYYCLNMVDVFDPKWQQGNNGEVALQQNLYQNDGYGGFNADPWVKSISLGDSDFVFALKGNGANPYGVGSYPHAAMLAATVNFQYSGFQDNKLYSKYAWASYLQKKYGTIDALNQSWSTSGFYTSFGDAGGFGTGTGILDEDGRHTAWFGSDIANRYFTLVGVNPNLVADLDGFLYQMTVQAYGVQASSIKTYDSHHILECGNFGGIGEGGMRPPVMQGLKDAGCDVIVGNWNSTWPAVALNGNQAEYDAVGLPVVLWYGISSQLDSDTSQYPMRGASFADYPSQYARNQQYNNDQQTIFNAQGSNGDYYIMGIAFWGLTDNSSEGTNWGFITFMDNGYDGRCAVAAQGSDQYGYPCGGEATNYGDFLDGVTQTNTTVLQQLIKSLQQ